MKVKILKHIKNRTMNVQKKSLTGLAKNSQDRCERTDVNPRMQTPLKNLVMVINEDLHNTRIHSKHTYVRMHRKINFLVVGTISPRYSKTI